MAPKGRGQGYCQIPYNTQNNYLPPQQEIIPFRMSAVPKVGNPVLEQLTGTEEKFQIKKKRGGDF